LSDPVKKSEKDMTLEELAHNMQFGADGVVYRKANAEVIRRQTQAQLDATAAQVKAAVAEEAAANAAIKAAEAAIESAGHAQRNTTYMLWSVIFAATSAFISLISTVWTNFPK
jgi:septal ring factor EnvC (AmiA/AmiB activator)